jgi:hypothetical protein
MIYHLARVAIIYDIMNVTYAGDTSLGLTIVIVIVKAETWSLSINRQRCIHPILLRRI